MVVREDTLLVERENSWHVKFSIGDSITKNFFHHLLFGRFTISSPNEITFLDLSLWFALFVLSTGVSFGFSLVWSTFLTD